MTDLLAISTPSPRPEAMPWQLPAAGGEEAGFLAILPAAEPGQAWVPGAMLPPEEGLAAEAGNADAPAPARDPLTSWLEASLGLCAEFQPPPQPLPAGIVLPVSPVAPQPAPLQTEAAPDDAPVPANAALQPETPDAPAPVPLPGSAHATLPEAAEWPMAEASAVPASPREPAPAAAPAPVAEAQPAADAPEDARPVDARLVDGGPVERPAPAETGARRPDSALRVLPEGVPVTTEPAATAPHLHRDLGISDRVAAPVGPAAPAEARPVLNQLTQAWVSATSDRTEIALSPEELGRLRLVFSGQDRSQVTILAERPETLDLVRRHADLLTQQLAEAGVQAGSLEFRQGTQRDWPQPTRSTGGLEGGPDPAPGPVLRPAPAPLSDRRIDIRL